jgi:UDP-N-acetylglucosamine:LPS N-acetylglucosamine transferase
VVLKDEDLKTQLGASILDLMGDESKRIAMKKAMSALANPGAAAAIAEILRGMALRRAQPTTEGGVND